MTLLNTVWCIVPNILDSNAQLTEILLYNKENFDTMNNATILDVTIKYLLETKRFDAQLL